MKKTIFLLFIIQIINNPIESSKKNIIRNLLMTKEEAKNKVIAELRRIGVKSSLNYPNDYKKYVTDLTSTTSVIFDQIPFSQIDSLKKTHKFPESTINKFKAIKYSKSVTGYETFNFFNEKSKTKIDNVYGVAARLDETNFYFAYVAGESSAKVIYQYNVIPYEDCHWILFIKSCSTKHRYVRRGFTLNELEIIKKSLIAKFYDNLHSILDLNKQKGLEKLKNFVQRNKKPYPPNYQKYFPIFQVFLEFSTEVLYNTYQIDALKYKGFSISTRDNIVKLIDNPNGQVNTFDILKCNSNECSIRIGVAYAINNDAIVFTYVEGVSISKNYRDYCINYSGGFMGGSFIENIQSCKDDPECVQACNNYRKILRDPYNPINEIPELKGDKQKEFEYNSSLILNYSIRNKIAEALNNIKF